MAGKGFGWHRDVGNDELDVLVGGTIVLSLDSAGVLTFPEATSFTANASANVTISNVAPAAVGTATISKWLTVVDSAGVTYFIPAWT